MTLGKMVRKTIQGGPSRWMWGPLQWGLDVGERGLSCMSKWEFITKEQGGGQWMELTEKKFFLLKLDNEEGNTEAQK